ncbi:Gfo/Idh/MocA family protein, partial [Vibrio sp. 10N.222.55.C6]
SDSDGIVVDVEALVKANVELVIVASPASFHAQHSIPLIEAGIPTLIEKPVTTTHEDTVAIQKAIDKYKTPVAVGYCLRYLPSAQKLKILLDSKAIGALYNAHVEIGQYLPDWRPSKDYKDC